MKQRITRAIVGVTALVVVLLGVPLAIAVQRFYESRATVELQRSAAQVVAELTMPLGTEGIAAIAGEPDVPAEFSVYDAAGSLLYGPGPIRADMDAPADMVVMSPITDGRAEAPVGYVRVARPRSTIDSEVRRTWAMMAIAAALGLAVAYAVARREAARLSAPISELAQRAERLGSDELALVPSTTTIPELDVLGDALSASSLRLAELIARERQFSANASHQLRTPLAALRVSLERGDLEAAGVEAERLTSTVEHMLALARDALPLPRLIDGGRVVEDAVRRWRPEFARVGRELVLRVDPALPRVRARPASLDQAMDVLLDNARRHGGGEVRVAVRSVAGGLVVQVDDDGPGITAPVAASLFERHEGSPHGIGLALARTLVEADGGRLLLADPSCADFRIVYAAAHSSAHEADEAGADGVVHS